MTQNTIFYALECFIFIFAVLIISFCIIIVQEINTPELINLKFFYQNWKKGPIIDIVSSNSTFCPNDYEPLIDDYWPGLTESCVCNDDESNNSQFGKVRRGKCRRKRDSIFFCKDFDSVKPRSYNVYKGKTLCAKRLNMVYLDFDIIPKLSSCTTGSRSCGKIDNLGNNLCMLNYFPCPINTIKILNKNQAISPTSIIYSKIDLGNEILYFTNQNPEGQIINEFKISENQPCAYPTYSNTVVTPFKLDPFYKASKCKIAINNETTDTRYIKIDEHFKADLLGENDITNIFNGYPDFSINTLTQKVNLYYRSYIGIDEKCINNLKSTQVNQTQGGFTKGILYNIDKITSKTAELASYSASTSAYASITMIFILITTLLYLSFIKFNQKLYFNSAYCHLLIKTSNIIISLIVFSFSCFQLGNINIISNLFTEILSQDFLSCGDMYTYNSFNNFKKMLVLIFSFSLSNILFTISIIIITSSIIVLLCYNSKKGTAKEKSPENESLINN